MNMSPLNHYLWLGNHLNSLSHLENASALLTPLHHITNYAHLTHPLAIYHLPHIRLGVIPRSTPRDPEHQWR